MKAAGRVEIVSGVAKIALDRSGQLAHPAVGIVVVSGEQGGAPVGHFPDASEMVAGIEIAGSGGNILPAVAEELLGHRASRTLLRDVQPAPDELLAAGCHSARVLLHDAHASPEAVIAELRARSIRIGDSHQLVLGIPAIGAGSIARHVAIGVIRETHGCAARNHHLIGARPGVVAGILCGDCDRVGACGQIDLGNEVRSARHLSRRTSHGHCTRFIERPFEQGGSTGLRARQLIERIVTCRANDPIDLLARPVAALIVGVSIRLDHGGPAAQHCAGQLIDGIVAKRIGLRRGSAPLLRPLQDPHRIRHVVELRQGCAPASQVGDLLKPEIPRLVFPLEIGHLTIRKSQTGKPIHAEGGILVGRSEGSQHVGP